MNSTTAAQLKGITTSHEVEVVRIDFVLCKEDWGVECMNETERLEVTQNSFVIGTNSLFVDFDHKEDPIKGALEFIKFSPLESGYHQI